MNDESDREERSKTRVIAYMWYCGDDCNCSEPIVERVTPNLEVGYPWVRRENLWSGDFRSDASLEESEKQKQELKEAAVRFEAELLE